ncbi:MAG: TIGR03617 family F420-dependent LLM class oxidoreductase [Porticoccaceae bacterium]
MKVIQRLRSNHSGNLQNVLPDFQRKTKLGYKAFFGFENKTNPFFAPLICAAHNNEVDFSTAIAVAFSKTPMVMALESYSVNQYCNGRFTLGLGSQIRPHILRRYGMPWSDKPARQMREYINALHAIWDAFENGGPLNFEGEVYKHTLITPEFTPYQGGFGRPKVMLGAVGPRMTEAAVDLTDGLMTHSFVSEKSLREINLNAIEARLAKIGKPRSQFEIQVPLFIATGSNEEEYKRNVEWHRHRIGFYSSTPAYKEVLDLHGWGDIHAETKKMTKEGRWDELGAPISDEMVDTYTVRGEPHEIAPKIKARFGDFVDTLQSNLELEDEEVQYGIIKAIEEI